MTEDRALRDTIRVLEEQLLDLRVRGDRAALERLLADEFVEFGASGCVFDREAVITALASESATEFAVHEFRATALAPDLVLATYRATARTPARGTERVSLRSSLWVHRSERWQLLFHQGTPIPPLG